MAKRYGKTLVRAAGLAAAAGGTYMALGSIAHSQLLSRKAAKRGFNQLSDADVLLGKEGAHLKEEQQSLMERVLEHMMRDAAGLEDFYDKPYYPSFIDGLQWFFANNPIKIVIDSPRGRRIHADMIKNETPSDVWVICLHGFCSSPRDFGGAAKIYHEWGYNTLLPYLCGHGESEDNFVSMGWLDRIDVAAWVDYLVREYGNPKIILHGVSMGAATTMMTTGEALPANVICAVADCGYTSVWDEYAVQARETLHIPVSLIHALDSVVRMKQGFSLKDASCVDQLKKSKTPTLFIHGDADGFVPFWMLDLVYDACAAQKEKVIAPGAGHAEACYQFELYYGAIRAFINRYLPKE